MIPRKGAEVAEITEKNMRDVLEVRKALEELAVQLACEKITAEEIEEMMKHFRENPLQEIAGSKVTLFHDYASLKGKDYVENETLTLDMPTTSNVLQYFTEDGTKVSIRPSGTEPKIKFYCEVHSKVKSLDELPAAEKAGAEKIEAIKASLGI